MGTEDTKAYINNLNNKLINSLDKYLGSDIICREERQFALLLYNAFLEEKRNPSKNKYTEEIVKKCLFGDKNEQFKIKDVYFEAALMRDYFKNEQIKANVKRNKEVIVEFNKKLLHFCINDVLEDAENILDELLKKKALRQDFLGQKTAKQAINEYCNLDANIQENIKKASEGNLNAEQNVKKKACLDVAGMMMNAKPDILVIYMQNNKTYAKALECKYKSEEGKYKDVAGAERKMQIYIQNCIMSFLFGKKNGNSYKFEFKESSAWKNYEDFGKRIYKDVYQKILEQSRNQNDITNKGVSIIEFYDSNKKLESEGENTVYINVQALLPEMYY